MNLIKNLQKRLIKVANRDTKKWFENYLKGAIKYYGVKSPKVSEIVTDWYKENHLYQLSAKQQYSIANLLLHQKYAEEKFAGIFFLQKFLLKILDDKWLVEQFTKLYQANCFYDWSTADWFTCRILIPMTQKNNQLKGEWMKWLDSSSLWQRRAGLVSMRALVKDDKNLPLIEKMIIKTIQDQQRFIQTGIGWLISDTSKIFPSQIAKIVEKYFDDLSLEIIDRHTKYLPKHKEYKKTKRIKSTNQRKPIEKINKTI